LAIALQQAFQRISRLPRTCATVRSDAPALCRSTGSAPTCQPPFQLSAKALPVRLQAAYPLACSVIHSRQNHAGTQLGTASALALVHTVSGALGTGRPRSPLFTCTTRCPVPRRAPLRDRTAANPFGGPGTGRPGIPLSYNRSPPSPQARQRAKPFRGPWYRQAGESPFLKPLAAAAPGAATGKPFRGPWYRQAGESPFL